MPDARLQRTREAYEGEVAFVWRAYGLCTRCGDLHADRDPCRVTGTMAAHLWRGVSSDECPCEACAERRCS